MKCIKLILTLIICFLPCALGANTEYSIIGELPEAEKFSITESYYDTSGKKKERTILSLEMENSLLDHRGKIDRPTAVLLRVMRKNRVEANCRAILEPGHGISLTIANGGSIQVNGDGALLEAVVLSWRKSSLYMETRDKLTATYNKLQEAIADKIENAPGLALDLMKTSDSLRNKAKEGLSKVASETTDPTIALLARLPQLGPETRATH